ncbi:MAG TPA: proton-translocating NADH-quinone oxidoreductase subunit N [Verrucomicrobiales bacterium]|nr:proton-translocating NADH-quinone oxidoreductase subunit N [Verrucomicrobiales bacterium]
MNASLMILELAILAGGVVFLLLDLWTEPARKHLLGYGAAALVAGVLLWSLRLEVTDPQLAFNGMYVLDPLALFFKRFFLVAGVVVLLLSVDYSDRIKTGIGEFYSLVLFALAGMMLAASANDFMMLFVSIELITVTFYVLTSFTRNRFSSLEAGTKYLILGALSSGLMVYGIALVFGSTGTMKFPELAAKGAALAHQKLFLVGALLVVSGLAFKIAAFPLQVWAPDVYQGSPAPATAFLAVGSKAAGFVLLLRFLFGALPHEVTASWTVVLMSISAVTILYGNLCALPQRNLKRILGYSSISNAGYMLLGVAAISQAGSAAVLYYLTGYLFTVLAAFVVLSVALRHVEGEDISSLAGLHHRSPLLAAALTLSTVSLAGIPPLAGFFGKFLLLKSALEQGPAYYWPVGIAVFGVVISLYYYFGVIRAIYWGGTAPSEGTVPVSRPMQLALWACMAGMLYLGLFPALPLDLAARAAASLRF